MGRRIFKRFDIQIKMATYMRACQLCRQKNLLLCSQGRSNIRYTCSITAKSLQLADHGYCQRYENRLDLEKLKVSERRLHQSNKSLFHNSARLLQKERTHLLSSSFSGITSYNYSQPLSASSSRPSAACFSSDSSSSGGSDSDGKDDAAKPEDEVEKQDQPDAAYHNQSPVNFPMSALTTMSVPEFFPNVPVIAISRNPVFPRFVKMIEVKSRLKFVINCKPFKNFHFKHLVITLFFFYPVGRIIIS